MMGATVQKCISAGIMVTFLLLGVTAPAEAQAEGTVVALRGKIHVQPADGSLLSRPAGLSVKGVTVPEALALLSTTASVSVAFSPNYLPGGVRVDCECRDVSIAEALDRILSATEFGYLELGDQVVIAKRAPKGTLESLTRLPAPPAQLEVGILPNGAWPVGSQESLPRDSPVSRQEPVVVGLVVDARTGFPMRGAQVVVVGAGQGVLTNEAGRFRITGVPGPSVELEVIMMGYRTTRREVRVGSADVRIELSEAVLELDELVVTATGLVRAREVGNTMARITSREIEASPARNALDLLTARAPGVLVMQNSGQPGAGGEIILRGINSISQGNSPIFYVDGVRVVNRSGAGHPGARVVTSPLDDINPADIERIEVVMGAAATTLYGTEASGGVVQIFTKRGHDGAARWTAEFTGGFNNVGHIGPKEGNPTGLWLNRCRGPGLVSHDGRVFEDVTCPDNGSWVRNAPLQRYNLSVAGGAERMSYFVSGNWSDERSVVQGDFGARSGGFRTNFSLAPVRGLELTLSSSYTRTNLNLFPDGQGHDAFLVNVTRGIGGNYTGAAGCTNPDAVCAANGENLKTENYSRSDRFLLGMTLSHQREAMSNRFAVGYHFTNSDMGRIRLFGHMQYPLGQIAVTDLLETKLTLDYVGSFRYSIGGGLTSTTSWGGQAFADGMRAAYSTGLEFSGPGLPTLSSAARRDVTESRTRVVNAGLFLQEMLAWQEQLFFTMGLRVDGNSAFGADFGLQAYPKASIAYVISESGFWPRDWWVDDLKLRAAFGEAGKAPGAFDAVRTWVPAPADNGSPGFTPGQLGNPSLGPERSREVEAGAEASLLDGVVKVDFTAFRQDTYGALIPVLYPPSQGFLNRQLENVGHLRNSGVGIRLDTRLIRTANVTWRATVDYSKTKNEAVDLGGEDITIETVSRTRIREGYPVPGVFGRVITNPTEFANPIVVADTFVGALYPDRTLSLGSNLALGRSVALDVLGEFQLGGHMVNGPGYQNGRQGNYPPCYAVQAKYLALRAGDSSALDDVRALDRARCALSGGPVRPEYDWWIEATDFFRLRSISLTYQVPGRFVPRQGSGSIQVAGRNLLTVTDYQGVDPEIDNTPRVINRREYYNFPTYRSFQITVRLNY